MPHAVRPADPRRGGRPPAHRHQPAAAPPAPGVPRRPLAGPGVGARLGAAGTAVRPSASWPPLEQVQPPTMTRIVASLTEAGMVTRVADPNDRRSARVRITPRASGRWSGCAPARTRSCCVAWASSAPRSSGTRPSWSSCSSTCWWSREAPHARGRPPHLPRHLGPQLPAVLHRPGHLRVGHLDADGGAGLPDPLPAPRHRCRCRHRHQPAVPAAAALRPVRRPDRRPARQAQGALRHPGAAGILALDPGPAGGHAFGQPCGRSTCWRRASGS